MVNLSLSSNRRVINVHYDDNKYNDNLLLTENTLEVNVNMRNSKRIIHNKTVSDGFQ